MWYPNQRNNFVCLNSKSDSEAIFMNEENKKEAVMETPSQESPKEAVKEKEETPSFELSARDHKMIDKDMRYRGPLSYRGFRLIGWVAMALMFVSMMLGLVLSVKSHMADANQAQLEGLSMASTVLSYFSALPLPLFLIANFAVILQSKNNYKKLIMTYLKITLIIYVVFIIVYYHYVVLFIMRIDECSFIEARNLSIEIFTALGKQNGLVVNVFVDLLCCVLIMLFIDYKPKKHFQGKKIALFRALVLLPILYEIGSAVLMGLLSMNALIPDFTFSLPPEILPLIGKKPIGMIFGFVLICIYTKMRERLYIKKGGTPEGYALYLKTNRNSFRFSLYMAIFFFVIAILDFFIVFTPIIIATNNGENADFAMKLLDVFEGFTLGKSFCLILVVPLIMLFSYSKQHENKQLDKLLPIVGIGLVVISIVETLFFGLLF